MRRGDLSTFADRCAVPLLALAVVVYYGLGLWLSRGVGFTVDELTYFGESRGFDPGSIFAPFGGHLTVTTRLFYEASLRLFGAEHLPFQVLTLTTAATVAVLLFFVVRRWVGAAAALAAALVILFLGTTPAVLQGNATMWAQAPVGGLIAYLALERGTRRGDVVACAGLLFAVISLEVGVAFCAGVAVWLLSEGERRRLWIPVLPILAYTAWWLWALQFDEGLADATNLLIAPQYAADSAAAAIAALSGLGLDLDLEASANLSTVALGWGRVLAIVVAVGIVVGLRRRAPDGVWWATLTFLVVLWLASSLTYGPLRVPDATRYTYPVAIGLVLLVAASFRGRSPQGVALRVLLGLTVVSLSCNLWLLRERGTQLRAASATTEVSLAMVELTRADVPLSSSESIRVPVRALDYLRSVDRFGSLATPLAEVPDLSPLLRRQADKTLGVILAPMAEPVATETPCRGPSSQATELPPGSFVLEPTADSVLMLRRFADEPEIDAGPVNAGRPYLLRLPPDESDLPWIASAPGAELISCDPS